MPGPFNQRPRHFPDDHPVELLRGYRIPTPSQAKRALIGRCTWLANKIETHVRTGDSAASGAMLAELAAVVVLIERVEQCVPPEELEEEQHPPWMRLRFAGDDLVMRGATAIDVLRYHCHRDHSLEARRGDLDAVMKRLADTFQLDTGYAAHATLEERCDAFVKHALATGFMVEVARLPVAT